MSRSRDRTFFRTRALHFRFYGEAGQLGVVLGRVNAGTCSSGVGPQMKDRTLCIMPDLCQAVVGVTMPKGKRVSLVY